MAIDQKQYRAMHASPKAYGTLTGPELLERTMIELLRKGRYDDGILAKIPSAEDRLRRTLVNRAHQGKF